MEPDPTLVGLGVSHGMKLTGAYINGHTASTQSRTDLLLSPEDTPLEGSPVPSWVPELFERVYVCRRRIHPNGVIHS